MKCLKILRTAALVLACLGMILPVPLVHAAVSKPAPAATGAIDVSLRPGGALLGQVVDSQGIPQADASVALVQRDAKIAQTVTNTSGYFLVNGLRGGVYQVVGGDTQGTYRLWAPDTAPPSAQPGALLVAGKGPIRGQCGPLMYWFSNPWVIAGLVATAVAIPVAIHNHRIDRNGDPVSP